MSGSSYVNIFGGSAVAPANPSYSFVSIAADTALVWPLESTETTPYVASLIDVSASTTGLHLAMPPANTGSTGVACIITNVGSNTYTLTDANGGTIVAIPTTQQWIIALIDNSTESGTWRAYQLASTTSSATASSLAGLGLHANGPLLEVALSTVYESAGTVITAVFRGFCVVYNGGSPATWSLDFIANLPNGWFIGYSNEGAFPVTLMPEGGETINGQASLIIQPGQSGFLVCSSSGFNTFGGLATPVSIVNGGTGATTAGSALTAFGGTAVGKSIFTAPSSSAVIALLGLSNFTFVESTVATSQTLASGSSNTIFVATAPLTITCPLTNSLTNKWCFGVYAQGGAVTVAPQASDSINGATEGASLTIQQGSSALFVTDANGNLWPLFLAAVPSGVWTTAGGSSDVITAAYSPPNTALSDGLLLGFRAGSANATSTPTFSPDGLTAHPITYFGGQPLKPSAIPGGAAETLVRYNLGNTRWELLNASSVSGGLPINVGGLATLTLTPAQAAYGILDLFGVLTQNFTLLVPAAFGQWTVRNITTGSFLLAVAPLGGSSFQFVTEFFSRILWTDGTNMFSATDDPLITQAVLAAIHNAELAYTTAGTFSFTVPAGITSVYGEGVGGGGGGGGAAATSGSQISVAPGGNAGTRGYGYFSVTPGDVIAVIVGAPGTAGAGTGSGSAGSGGTSSFGSFLSAPGGTGAPNGPQVANGAVVQGPASASGVTTGGSINGGEVAGAAGMSGAGGSNVVGGTGGQGPFGGGGNGGTNAVGSAGFAPGAGGGGASSAPSAGSGFVGGAGASGAVIVRWLAGT